MQAEGFISAWEDSLEVTATFNLFDQLDERYSLSFEGKRSILKQKRSSFSST